LSCLTSACLALPQLVLPYLSLSCLTSACLALPNLFTLPNLTYPYLTLFTTTGSSISGRFSFFALC
jgi:hypothetical protein